MTVYLRYTPQFVKYIVKPVLGETPVDYLTEVNPEHWYLVTPVVTVFFIIPMSIISEYFLERNIAHYGTLLLNKCNGFNTKVWKFIFYMTMMFTFYTFYILTEHSFFTPPK